MFNVGSLFGWQVMGVMVLLDVDVFEQSCWFFDDVCKGLVLGEGVVVLVFEIEMYVCVCGVMLLVVLVGYGYSVDVVYLFCFDVIGQVCVMLVVLCDVGFLLVDIGYINVYGMVIEVGDVVEVVFIVVVFGWCIVFVLVIKVLYGYLIGVGGVLELVVIV